MALSMVSPCCDSRHDDYAINHQDNEQQLHTEKGQPQLAVSCRCMSQACSSLCTLVAELFVAAALAVCNSRESHCASGEAEAPLISQHAKCDHNATVCAHLHVPELIQGPAYDVLDVVLWVMPLKALMQLLQLI